ncbi:MAG: hypothetical protein IT263_01500 [Saprospiraceae bacterium]|nr:hypothetical protein [Saprospiraceae bacterium]
MYIFFAFYFILGINSDLVISDRTFNYGIGTYDVTAPLDRVMRTSSQVKHDLTITNTGKVWINRDDRIAYTDDTDNVFNTAGKHFDVTLGKDICGDAAREITVQD